MNRCTLLLQTKKFSKKKKHFFFFHMNQECLDNVCTFWMQIINVLNFIYLCVTTTIVYETLLQPSKISGEKKKTGFYLLYITIKNITYSNCNQKAQNNCNRIIYSNSEFKKSIIFGFISIPYEKRHGFCVTSCKKNLFNSVLSGRLSDWKITWDVSKKIIKKILNNLVPFDNINIWRKTQRKKENNCEQI